MSLSFAVFTFINVWWLMLFIVLPFGVVKAQNPTAFEYVAAPQTRQWKKTLLINTALSFVITAVLAIVINCSGIHLDSLFDVLS